MKDLGRLVLRYKLISALFGAMAVVYVVQSILAPVEAATLHKYHVSSFRLHEVTLAVGLPYVVIWIIALVGYLRLRAYTESLGKSKDGAAFGLITKGVFWFTVWLPLSALTSAAGSYAIFYHSSATENIIRLEVYSNVLLLVPAFIYVFQGSKALLRITRARQMPFRQWLAFAFVSFSAIYTYITFHDNSRQAATGASIYATYYMPDWLILVTIVIPRLMLWLVGILALCNILAYRQKVAGIIYRDALRHLVLGLGGVIFLVILMRLIQSLNNPLGELSLAGVLLVVYLLLLLMSVAYVMVAKGAKKLLIIEET
jgi:hypothetical protein